MKRVLFYITILLIMSGCSTMKLMDNSSDLGYSAIQYKKVLVAAKSTDINVRQSYENRLVERLQQQKVNAVAAWAEFEELTEESLADKSENEIVTMFRNAGIEIIVVTALNDVIEKTKVNRNKTVDFDTTQKGKYLGISFSDYYDNASNLPVLPARDGEAAAIQSEGNYKTYILEAVVYDLTRSSGERLIGSLLVEAESPSHASEVLNGFTRIVSDELTSN